MHHYVYLNGLDHTHTHTHTCSFTVVTFALLPVPQNGSIPESRAYNLTYNINPELSVD